MRLVTVSLLFMCFFFVGCKQEDTTPLGQYLRAVEAGLEEEPSTAETVMGIHLNDTDREFYDRCTELNRQQLITMAGGSNQVAHELKNDLDRPARMTFQPVFTQTNPRRIDAMELTFIYDEWSPWNKTAYADQLLPRVAEYMSRIQNVEFIQLVHPHFGDMYVHVNGSMHLALWAADDSTVKGRFTDLSGLDGDPLHLRGN
ncbi:hypothetical protein GGR28_000185 [Lewinella aquimaris]|uniref:Lipoprotein n=1 Tax=Neolewinella aquimaris TaxID=1835722 RepID=A0A840DWL5_9BACT|nr:hypothetical protein [Neolewinella aquimaris]MBB4077584.1 hypothetical protein [Neolewinella aquimaris]